jgi:hypothetical protein
VQVCLFEQESSLGGHCDTVYFEPPAGQPYNWVDPGVLIYENSSAQPLGTWNLNSVNHVLRFSPNGILPVQGQ